MIKKINIAIDGPSAAGKSTVSKEVAKRLGYTFINTGSFYRVVALFAENNKVPFNDEKAIIALLKSINIKIDAKENIYLNDKNVSMEIRSDSISQGSSTVATYKKVREFVVSSIQDITNRNKGYIMDGRDTTFRIMPNAELKIFLVASAEERAKRRVIDNRRKHYETDYNVILEEIKKRDFRDTNREVDPLHKTKDAIEVDCTNMKFEEVVECIIELAKERMKA